MINIVQIQTALLLPVTAQFIVDKLGIKPAKTEKRAVYWDDGDFTHICQGLIQHITAARNADFGKISSERPKRVEAAPAAAEPAGDFFDDAPAKAEEPAGDFFGDEPQAAADTAEEFF